MRDLVETVIGQVMRQDSAWEGASSGVTGKARMPQAPHRVHHLTPAGRSAADMPGDSDPLWRASQAFESLFVEQMMASMRKTIPDSGLLKKGFAEGVSSTMMDQAVADSIGKQGRMGIATSLYRQLSSQYPGGDTPAVAGQQAGIPETGAHAIAQNGDKQKTPLSSQAASGIEGERHGTY